MMKNAFLKLKNAFKENIEKNKTFVSQIPNILTCSRALAPFIILPLVFTGNIPGAIIAGAILASTDFFDGILARKLDAQSEFGRLMDPIVDKIFAITLLAGGASINPLLICNIIPEIAIGAVNYKALSENKKVKSSKFGKIKTWILSINILLSFIPSISIIYKIISTYVTFVAQAITFNNYVKEIKKQYVEDEKKTIESIEDKEEKSENLEKKIEEPVITKPNVEKTPREIELERLLRVTKEILEARKQKENEAQAYIKKM